MIGDKEIIEDKKESEAQLRLTLRKGEKLRHRSLVERIFAEGKSVYAYPLRAVWRVYNADELEKNFRTGVPPRIDSMQMLITVPKKKRRHAVDRVLMRRRIREAYRLERLELKQIVRQSEEMRLLSIAFIYIAEKNEDFGIVRSRMQKLLGKIREELERVYESRNAAEKIKIAQDGEN